MRIVLASRLLKNFTYQKILLPIYVVKRAVVHHLSWSHNESLKDFNREEGKRKREKRTHNIILAAECTNSCIYINLRPQITKITLKITNQQNEFRPALKALAVSTQFLLET